MGKESKLLNRLQFIVLQGDNAVEMSSHENGKWLEVEWIIQDIS